MTSQNDTNLKKNFENEHDPESLLVVRGQYADLQSMIDSLNDKLNLVSDFQEKEFLSAYRVHMLSVQLELKELQEKVAKAEMLLQDDGEVSKLEEECNWFRNETNRLQTHSATMQHDIHALRTRLTALRDQNQYLSSQLKAVMKHSRVLEVETEMAKQNIEFYQLQEQGTEGGGEGEEEGSRSHLSSHRDHQSLSYSSDEEEAATGGADEEEALSSPPTGVGGGGMGKSLSAIALGNHPPRVFTPNPVMRRVQSVGPDSLLPIKHRANSPGGARGPPLSPSHRGNTSSLRRNGGGRSSAGTGIRSGVGQQSFQTEIKSLQRQLDSLLSSKSDLEFEIEENVRNVFQNVVKRRSLGVARNSKNRYFQALARQADATGQDSIDQELDLFQFSSKTPVDRLGHPVVGGITELGLEHLTDSDRKEAMINLLSNSDVFEIVVRNLGYHFPIL